MERVEDASRFYNSSSKWYVNDDQVLYDDPDNSGLSSPTCHTRWKGKAKQCYLSNNVGVVRVGQERKDQFKDFCKFLS